MVIFDNSQTGTGLGVDFTMTLNIAANAIVLVSSHTSNNTNANPTSPNLTFVQIGSSLSYSGNGMQNIYRAKSTTALAGEVITINTNGTGPQVTGAVVTAIGADLTGTSGSGAIGATNTFTSGGATANTATITTTRRNSLVIGLFGQTSNATMTAGTGQTAITSTAQAFSRSSIARRQAVSPTQEVVISNETMGASVPCGMIAIELLSASPVATDFNNSGLRPHPFSPGIAR